MHIVSALAKDSDLIASGMALVVGNPPMLSVVTIDAEKHFLASSDAADDGPTRFMSTVLPCLHPLGAIAFSVPRPWLQHGPRIRSKFGADFCCATAF